MFNHYSHPSDIFYGRVESLVMLFIQYLLEELYHDVQEMLAASSRADDQSTTQVYAEVVKIASEPVNGSLPAPILWRYWLEGKLKLSSRYV
jgi:hypothetical protein